MWDAFPRCQYHFRLSKGEIQRKRAKFVPSVAVLEQNEYPFNLRHRIFVSNKGFLKNVHEHSHRACVFEHKTLRTEIFQKNLLLELIPKYAGISRYEPISRKDQICVSLTDWI